MADNNEFISNFPFSYMGPKFVRFSDNGYGIRCQEEYTTQPIITYHTKNYIEVSVITEGHGTHHVNGNDIEIKRGSFHLLGIKDTTSFTVKSSKLAFKNLCINIKKLPFETVDLICSAPLPVFGNLTPEEHNVILGYLKKLEVLQHSKEPYVQNQINAYIILIITELLKLGKHIKSQKQRTEFSYIESALQYITKNYNSKITLANAADTIGLSPNYLSKIFSGYMNYTFMEYLNYYRVRMAESLILTTPKSLTEIAFSVGFESLSSFSRAFNKPSSLSSSK